MRTAWIVGSRDNVTNELLAACWRACGVDAVVATGQHALASARQQDVALGRLDVLPTFDGVEPGLLSLFRLERRGIRVLNRAAALVAVHDKLRTAHCLAAAGLPRPRTEHLRTVADVPSFAPPLVVKPRFGSWGGEVRRCESEADLARQLEEVAERPWFRRHGALVQELVPPQGRDLRVIVAGGAVVGASARVARAGEWRTNVSLGGTLEPVRVSGEARALAVAAAAAVGGDLVGVDLLPRPSGELLVLELNGAVDFDDRYALGGRDPCVEAARALFGEAAAAAAA